MIAFFIACTGPVDSGEEAEDQDQAVLCSDELDVEVAATGSGTVPRVTWETETAVVSYVRFNNGSERTRESAPGEAGTVHDALLLGILPNAEFAWEILVVDEEGERCIAAGTAENGSLPAGLPEATATVGKGSAAGLTVAPVLSGGLEMDTWLVIYDEEGRAVWAYEASAGAGGAGFLTTAAFANDGSGVLFNAAALSADAPGWIANVSFDGVFRRVAEVNGLHTDFVEMDEGRIASLTWEVREVWGRRLLGDHVVVIEADGSSTSIWNSFDSLPFDPDGDWEEGFYVPDPTVSDWSHVNSISWNAEANALMITMTAQDGVAKLDAATGAMSWLYGRGVGDFGDQVGLTVAPHSAELLDNGDVLVFNRGDFLHDPVNACSWAAELAVDEAPLGIVEVRRWEAPECTLVTYLGMARRLAGEVTLVDWTSAGRIDQLTAGNEVAWSVSLGAGHAFGYADFLPLSEVNP